MSFQKGIKFKSILEFWEFLPEHERVIVDVLRQIVLKNLPSHCKEKLATMFPTFMENEEFV